MKSKASPERIDDRPGPGHYDANADSVKDRIKTAKIGKDKRDYLGMSHNEIMQPGPGNYEVSV